MASPMVGSTGTHICCVKVKLAEFAKNGIIQSSQNESKIERKKINFCLTFISKLILFSETDFSSELIKICYYSEKLWLQINFFNACFSLGIMDGQQQ